MNSRHWWNGRWSKLVRRDVFVRSATSMEGRVEEWLVELRRGGPGGRARSRSFATQREAVDWVESALLDAEAGWREITPIADARRQGKVARKAGIAS